MGSVFRSWRAERTAAREADMVLGEWELRYGRRRDPLEEESIGRYGVDRRVVGFGGEGERCVGRFVNVIGREVTLVERAWTLAGSVSARGNAAMTACFSLFEYARRLT